MPLQWCSNRQFTAPAAAASVTITPAGSGVYSSWVTVFTATADSVLTEVIFQNLPKVAGLFDGQVGISVGGGAETVIASLAGGCLFGSGAGLGTHPFRIPIDAIPSGAVVKVRMRLFNASTSAWAVAACYYEKPIIGTILTTTQPQLVTGFVMFKPNNPWVNGTPVTMHTFASDSVISGYALAGVNKQMVIDFTISGTPIYTSREGFGISDLDCYRTMKHPLHVAAGSTVQIRGRCPTGDPETWVCLSYHELPL